MKRLQRQEEEEETMQMKHLQRQELPEEEMLQGKRLQRQEEEEEMMQAKRKPGAAVQRHAGHAHDEGHEA
jgi:hypothetical protein